MAQTAFSIRMDEGLKRDFSQFCENIGMSMSTAFVVFAKATLRSRRIPFEIYDYRQQAADEKAAEAERVRQRAIEAFTQMRANIQDRYKDMREPTMAEIEAGIARARKERRQRKARKLKATAGV